MHDVERVKNNLASLFNTSASRLDSLFQDRLVVIKRDMDLTDADRYRDTVERIGGYCIIEVMHETAEQSVLNLATKTEKMVCPKCQSVQQIKPVCSACGVIVEEFRKKIEQNKVAVMESIKGQTGKILPVAESVVSTSNQTSNVDSLDQNSSSR